MYPDADCKNLSRHVVDFEDLDGTQEMQSHCRYLQSVLIAIADG